MADGCYPMVAALCIGKPYSSFAFAFTSNQDSVYVNKNWSDLQRKPFYHTPSTILINGGGEFVSFGYDAECQYNELSEDDLGEFDLFRNIQTFLYEKKKPDTSAMMESVSGREYPAIRVFAMALNFLKKKFLQTLSREGCSTDENDVKWVVTIPNTNCHFIKDFMKNAAEKAGIGSSTDPNKLLFALESEVLSSYCHHFGKQYHLYTEARKEFIIVHVGGSTVDITAHRIVCDGNFEEIIKPLQVSNCKEEMTTMFEILIEKIMGQNCLSTFKKENFHAWQSVLNSLEIGSASLTKGILIPNGLDLIDYIIKSDIDITKSESSGVSFTNGIICINKDTVWNFVQQSSNLILCYLQEILSRTEQANLQMFVVGVNRERYFLCDKIMETFSESDVQVIGPDILQSDIPTISGAVLFAFNPKIIKTSSNFETEIPDAFYANVMVAAIDIGTAFSGYGFSFSSAPSQVIINKTWADSSAGAMDKTSTTVLVDSNREFVFFGAEAESHYAELSKDKLRHYELFRNFKMMLYGNENLDHYTKIKSLSGRSCSAMKIFAMTLKYLKNHLMSAVSKQTVSSPSNDLIKWVITIPSIWNESAKEFMRNAAKEAGLIRTTNSKQLVLALEAEAASIYCRNHFKDEETFTVGTKYMLIDAGGGTADIATHEVLPNEDLKEIIKSTGVKGGGDEVNVKFEKLLQDLMGVSFINAYREEHPSRWLTLLKSFENGKRSVTIKKDSKLRVLIPYSMNKMFKEQKKKTIKDGIVSIDGVSVNQGALCMNEQIVSNLFSPVISKIIDHLKERKHSIIQHGIKYFFVVGGFGENKLLINRLEEEFSDQVKVLKPDSSGHSVLMGAVLYGHNPKAIRRISEYMYTGTELSRNRLVRKSKRFLYT